MSVTIYLRLGEEKADYRVDMAVPVIIKKPYYTYFKSFLYKEEEKEKEEKLVFRIQCLHLLGICVGFESKLAWDMVFTTIDIISQ